MSKSAASLHLITIRHGRKEPTETHPRWSHIMSAEDAQLKLVAAVYPNL